MAKDALTNYGTPPGPPGPIEGVLVDRADAVDAEPLYQLPTAPVELNSFQTGWLMAFVLPRAMNPNDVTARAIYLKLKAASIALGVEWYYGDPPGLEDKG
jgi:hypothetical protein